MKICLRPISPGPTFRRPPLIVASGPVLSPGKLLVVSRVRMLPAAYLEPHKKHGKAIMQAVIDSVASSVPATLTEICKLGRTLKPRAADILAFFDRPGTSNGPTEAIKGRLEHLCGSALGFPDYLKLSAKRMRSSPKCELYRVSS